jgi:predicted transglutaminase-like cysteine proteinase
MAGFALMALVACPARAGTGDKLGSAAGLPLFETPRWTELLARVDTAAPPSRTLCMLPAETLPQDCAYRAWRQALLAESARPMAERIVAVHQAVNRLRYVPDAQNWGMADRWETPAELFARGGDCEDFALAKYFLLRDLGVEEAALRLAILWDRDDGEQHAVLFVESEGQRWVLDNKFAAPIPAEALADRYRVIWSVNRDGAVLAADAFGTGLARGRMRLARGGKTLVIRTARAKRRRPAAPIELADRGASRRTALARFGTMLALQPASAAIQPAPGADMQSVQAQLGGR